MQVGYRDSHQYLQPINTAMLSLHIYFLGDLND